MCVLKSNQEIRLIEIQEYSDDGESLHVSVTMPSIEVGTVGGGTHLPAQVDTFINK